MHQNLHFKAPRQVSDDGSDLAEPDHAQHFIEDFTALKGFSSPIGRISW